MTESLLELLIAAKNFLSLGSELRNDRPFGIELLDNFCRNMIANKMMLWVQKETYPFEENYKKYHSRRSLEETTHWQVIHYLYGFTKDRNIFYIPNEKYDYPAKFFIKSWKSVFRTKIMKILDFCNVFHWTPGIPKNSFINNMEEFYIFLRNLLRSGLNQCFFFFGLN